MTKRPPYDRIAGLFAILLISLTVTAAPADAGLVDKAKSFAPRLASGGLIKAIGDYVGNVQDKGTALIKDGLSGTVDAATYNRRADEFFDKDVNLGVKSFLKDAADNLKLKVANPLEGLKEKLGDTRLGQLVSRVQEKIQGTTADGPAIGVVKPDESYDPIDPRLALDIQEEETEWYRDETGIMDEASLSVAYLNEEIDSLDDALDGSHREVAYQDEEAWADQTDVAHRTGEEQEGWSDPDESADAWEDGSTPEYCQNVWIDIDAVSECDDGYQGASSRFEETDVAGKFDAAQEGTYQEALDRLVGDDTESYADADSGSDGGYEGMLAQLEAEAAERERLARLEAEAAEQERQARLAAEAAEREREAQRAAAAAEQERQARLAAKRAERERKEREYYAKLEQLQLEEELSRQRMQQDYNSSFLGQFNNMMNGIRGMAPTFPRGGVASQPSSHCESIAPQLNSEVTRELNAMNLEGGGMCQSARNYIRALSHAKDRLNQYGCYNGEYEQAIQQAQQSARAACY